MADTEQNGEKKRITRSSLQGLRFLLGYMKPYRWKFIIALFSLLLSSLAGLAFPGLTGLLIDAVTKPEQTEFSLNTLTLILLGVLVLQSGFSFVRSYFIMEVAERSLADLRQNLYTRILLLPMDFFHRNRVGDMTSRMTTDVTTLHTTMTTTLSEIIRQSVIMIGGIALVIYTSSQLTVIILGAIPIVVVVAVVFGRMIRKASKTVQDMYAGLNTIAEETFQGISVVKAFTAERRESKRYRGELLDLIGVALRVARARGFFIAFIIFVLFGGIVGVIWYGGNLVQAGELSIGELTSFILYALFVGGAMGSFADLYGGLQRSLGASERIQEMLEDDTEPIPDAPAPSLQLEGALELRNVHFAYPSRSDVPVLKDISLEVPSGTSLALVGPSGSGKSTIANLLMRFYTADEGQILVDGTDITDYDLAGYRNSLAIVPQDIVLFGGTIAENIAYGKPGASEEEITEAARLANALDFIQSFPSGLQTVVGERGVQLSGGQRQRVAIARAILKNPSILILDEATSSLDSESESLVQEALERVMKGRTTIIIAHRLSTIRDADKIGVLYHGELAETGTYEELTASRGVFARLVALQSRVGDDVIDEDVLL